MKPRQKYLRPPAWSLAPLCLVLVAGLVACGEYDPQLDGESTAVPGQQGVTKVTQHLDIFGNPASSDLLSDFGKKSVIISGLPVVNDLSRSQPDPCIAVPADAKKKWTLGYLLSQASALTPTTTTASNYVNHWLTTWATNQVINNQTVAPKGLGQQLKDEWLRKSGSSTTYKMEYAPYRLSAIVPRFDLRKRRRFDEGLAGELRFVFGRVSATEPVDPSTDLENGGGCPTSRQTTLILEYAVDKATENDVRAWAQAWADLAKESFGSATYLSKLQTLTESVVAAGKGSGFKRPNDSELIRIRVVENPAAEGAWTFREWVVNRTTKLPEPATVKQTPMLAMRLEKSSYVGNWASANAAAIFNDTYVVPDTFLGGARMAGGEDRHDSNDISTENWTVGFSSGQLRHLFNKGTCNGCHTGETGFNFFAHIEPRFKKTEARLSDFLTGGDFTNPGQGQFAVADPVDGTVRYFNEARDREQDLLAVVNGQPRDLPVGIKSVNLATYFTLVNWNSAKCLDFATNSDGTALAQYTCNGNANQRLTPIDMGNGYHGIRLKQNSNSCLQAASAANSAGEWLVTRQACSASATSQQVSVIASSDFYELKFRNTGKCLNLANVNNNTKALQKTCDHSANQQFYLVE